MKKIDQDRIAKVEQLYKEYKNLIYSIAYDILKDDEWAEDALQDTVLRLLKHADKIEPEKKTETKNYIARMARNRSIDLYNSRKRTDSTYEFAEEIDIEEQSEKNDPEQYVVTNESVAQIIEEIRNMDPRYSDPLRFQKFDRYSIEEIAEIMGISVRTVHYRLNRAKEILADKLGKEATGYDK